MALLFGMLVMSASMFAASFSTSYAMYIALQSIAGFGQCGVFQISVVLVRSLN